MFQNVKKWIKSPTVLAASIAVVLLIFVQASAAAIARGYTTSDSGLQTGMVVALTANGAADSSVERATQDNSDRVVGVVTTFNNSLITVSSGNTQVLVESEGQVDAYVSDINGTVHQGDLLVLSPLKGILMKASDTVSANVIGIAADAPTATSLYQYQDGNKTKSTNIAKIKINLNHQGANAAVSQSDSALAKLGRTLVGREVGETRVLAALILFVIVLIAEGGIIYGAISSSITALGRNPLARKVIRSELIRVVIIALIVLFAGLGAVYAVLWV